jgi:hypothetical protein
MQTLLAIDFEASCLPSHGRSFPIEVGIADLAGWSRSWLIKPDPEWRDWSWTAEAEALHGISRQQLDREGLLAAEVLDVLNTSTRGYRVISDNDLDRAWLSTLSQAAGVPADFRIGHIAELLDLYHPTADGISEAVARADRVAPDRHKARFDALWLASVADSLVRGQPSNTDRPIFAWDRPATSTPLMTGCSFQETAPKT